MTAARAPLPIHPPVPLTCNNTKTVVAPREFRDWLGALRDQAELLRAAGYFVMVPALMLSLTREVLSGTGIAYGGQDCAAESESVTGETPASHLADFGCTCVMLGQQQRRQLRGEDSATVAAKAARAGEAGLVPVVCAGEAEHCPPAEAAETVATRRHPPRRTPPGKSRDRRRGPRSGGQRDPRRSARRKGRRRRLRLLTGRR
ncbi:triose-phosphate isomerase [Streptomyces koyangensis]|uniref:triose-phosphate isomerase n=1 Tax=Streptomyces koyangensis TaxID=188770 RepID=UPI003C2DAA2E